MSGVLCHAGMVDTNDEAPEYDDAVMRWTVRTLYALAIGLNVWVAWYEVRERPEYEIARAKVAVALRNLTAPIRERNLFRRQVNRVLFEADAIKEAAADA